MKLFKTLYKPKKMFIIKDLRIYNNLVVIILLLKWMKLIVKEVKRKQ